MKTFWMLQIILQTAKYVRHSGGQTEFVLRVKQANNPNFEFLEPSSLHHAYFRWLVSTKPEVNFGRSSVPPQPFATVVCISRREENQLADLIPHAGDDSHRCSTNGLIGGEASRYVQQQLLQAVVVIWACKTHLAV